MEDTIPDTSDDTGRYRRTGDNGGAGGAGGARGAPVSSEPVRPDLVSTRRHSVRLPTLFFDVDADGDVEEGGRKYNPAVQAFIRDEWIREQVDAREDEFTTFDTIHATVGTWNVNGKVPDEDLSSWMTSLRGEDGSLPELVVAGFQEIVDLNAANVVVSGQTDKHSAMWNERLLRTLNEAAGGDPYQLVSTKALVGILISVFARSSVAPCISEVQANVAGVGVMGFVGNKGGAAVRLRYNDSTLCFVCSHLAASRKNVAARNSDYANIINKLVFTDAARAAAARASVVEGDNGSFGILDHDVTVWLGDLNYRIVEGIPIDEVHDRVVANDLEYLRDRDQLNIERGEGRVFNEFEEATVTFLPTYKYQVGTDLYERRPEKKHRAPAWCDRILWRTRSDADHCQILTYARTEQRGSDHKPVHALFKLRVRSTVMEKKRAVLRSIMQRLTKLENSALPSVELSASEVSFGEVKYRDAPVATLKVKNVGDVPAQWRFSPKLEEMVICKPWLLIEPAFGMLLPGEEVEIMLACFVGAAMSRALLSGREKIEDIVVMRLENGRDFFVTIAGAYRPTAFGASLPDLLYTNDPVAWSPFAATWQDAGGFDRASARVRALTEGATPLAVPKEVWRLADFVLAHGMDAPGLFVDAGPEAECAKIRDAVDTGAPLDASLGPLSVAAVLLELLASWQEPVIPCEMFPGAEFASVPLDKWCSNLLRRLPNENYNVLVYVAAFAREAVEHGSTNGLSPALAAQAFAPCLMWPKPTADLAAVAEAEVAARAAGRPTGGPLTQSKPSPELAAAIASARQSRPVAAAAAPPPPPPATADLLGLMGSSGDASAPAAATAVVTATGAKQGTPRASPIAGFVRPGPTTLPARGDMIDQDEIDLGGPVRIVTPAQEAARWRVVQHLLTTPTLE